MTLREALTRAASQFDQNPDLRPDALRDAVLLLLHTLDISQTTLLANPDRTITLDEQARYQSLILRRLTNEPIQYITGEQEFYGLALHVTPAVLIPRPETELLVEAVLSELLPAASRACSNAIRVLDVGTGSGAIAIALAHHLPGAEITGLDISPAALEVAAANAARHNEGARIRFLQSDLLADLPYGEPEFDAIVSNPPYVAAAHRATLHPQVRDHEPAGALFAGPEGMDIYRRLVPQAWAALRHHGLLALEFGYNQREAITGLLSGWSEVRFIEDLQRIPRVAVARRP
jgi:release factor glutamine methyltransferase